MSTPQHPPEGPQRNRKGKLVVGAGSLLASSVFRQVIAILTLAVTARLLTPEDFGIAAYFLVSVTFFELIQRQAGMVLIRLEKVDDAHFHTVLTMQIITSIGLALLTLALLPLIDRAGISGLRDLLYVTAGLSLVIALRSPKFLMYERGLRFGFIVGEETSTRLAYAVTVLILAYLWRDYWAIVVATVIAQIVRSAWTFATAPMPLRLSLSRWRDCLSFTGWSTLAQIAQFCAMNSPQVIIGAALGLADAGLYRLGTRAVNLVTSQLFAPMQRVVYPGLANLARETDRKVEGFRQLNAAILTLLLPLSIGMALVAQEVITLGFGPQWIGATAIVSVIAPLQAVLAIQTNVRSSVYISGNTFNLFIRNLLILIVTLLAMWVGVGFGLMGAIAAAGFGILFSLSTTLYLSYRIGNGPFLSPLTVAWRAWVGVAVMAPVVWGIKTLLYAQPDAPSSVSVILICAGLGLALYALIVGVLWLRAGRPAGVESIIAGLFGRVVSRLR